MKKKLLIVASSAAVAMVATLSITAFNSGIFSAFAADQNVWYHYAAVEPTDTMYGSKEFWANSVNNCSTHVFENPGVPCVEKDFSTYQSFLDLVPDDDRYVPSINQQNGIDPCIYESSGVVTYGLYPQTNVNDSALIDALESIPEPEVDNGYYLYNGKYYVKDEANPCSENYSFDNETVIVSGTTYWYACEPIFWNILSSEDGAYYLLSDKLLNVQKFSASLNNYKNSSLRYFLNHGFYDSAFALNNSFVKTVEVDNSAKTTNSNANEYVCSNTHDKVFLPSYRDYLNPDYGFTDTATSTPTRKSKTTDFARANGAYSYSGVFAPYWTRSPSSTVNTAVSYIEYNGIITSYSNTSTETWCIRPSIMLDTNPAPAVIGDGATPAFSKDGRSVVYGIYPRSNIKDPALISELNEIESPEANGYYLYEGEYYAKTEAAPYMEGTYFNSGAKIIAGSTYWFKCEPITWRILSHNFDDCYILSEELLDAHRFNESYSGKVDGHYASNYEYSEIRSWLNNEFYNLAFTLDDSYVKTTEVDNSATTTASDPNQYACENTSDKVFLPSYQDYINTEYGFSSSYNTEDYAREAYTTDWARARGARFSTSGSSGAGGNYWTRSPSSGSLAYKVTNNDGYVNTLGISVENSAVRPSITLKDLEPEIGPAPAPVVDEYSPAISLDGKKLTYGIYPQTVVEDASLISVLNSLEIDEESGYYLYASEYYAKVEANPYSSNYYFDNGTKIVKGTTYWFKCEAITWRILSNEPGDYYVMAESLLDAFRYNESYSGRKYGYYANNYRESRIRNWLNDEFYNSAFALNDSYVKTTEVDNSAATTDSESNPYYCKNMYDKVFLPSYQDLINTNYGFSSTPGSDDAARAGRPTDWAKARGAYSNPSDPTYQYYGTSWTRSPDSSNSRNIWLCDYAGALINAPGGANICARPALKINLA